ncbi:MAG: hypothetical protein E7052_08325 [Lentisphaerae bacterium]|nr:hypothetical protein [Lentisphaerota bacterium]
MKKTICSVILLTAAIAGAVDGSWKSRGSAVLDPAGKNQAGNPCITAVGSGAGKGYGGLQLTFSEALDLKGAGAGDTVRFKTFQNINGLVVMFQGKNTQCYQSMRLPADGTEVVLTLDPAKWQGCKGEWGSYTGMVFYQSAFKQRYKSLGITSLVIEKGGKKLYEYQSSNTLAVRTNQVYNLGRGGHNSADLLRRQLAKALKLRPTLAVVMVGSNDAGNPRKMLTLDKYEANLRKLTADLEKSGAKIILITPPPCIPEIVYKRSSKEKIGDVSATVLKIVAIIKKLAAEKGYPLVDYYDIVSRKAPLESAESYLRNPANSDSLDGVHPTREGYAALSKAVLEVIRQQQLPTARVVCLGDSITFGSAMLGAGTSYGTSYPAQLAELLNPAGK